MMMRKRAVAAFAVIIGALLVMSGLTGCGGNEEENDPYWPRGYIEETLEGGFVVWKYKDGRCELSRYEGTATEVTIPNGITKIGWVFSGNDSITKVTIPDNVTIAIDEMAFGNCTALETVIIGDGVTEICDGAFFNCTALKTVTIGDGVKEIGDRAFYSCAKLTSVTIPDSVVSIGELAFALGEAHSDHGVDENGENKCPKTALEKVVLGKGLKSMGRGVFENCCYIKTVEYRGTLKDWCELDKGEYLLTFAESVTIPVGEGNTVDILKYTEGNADDFAIEIPEGTTKIGSFSFYHAKHLTGVTIPNSVKSIGNDAFNGCMNLSAVPTLREGLTSIGERAFYFCTALKGELVIPKSVNKVGWGAFDDCWQITKLEIKNGNMEFSPSSFSFNSLVGVARYSKCQTVILPEGLEKIPNAMFRNYEDLKTVELSAGLKEIQSYAFDGCKSLTDITIPDGTEKIGEYAFLSCSALTEITIPASMKKIDKGAFSGCYVGFGNETAVKITFADTDGWFMCDYDESSYGPNYDTEKPVEKTVLGDSEEIGKLLSTNVVDSGSYYDKYLYKKS